ncbi:MAG: hypothetical protein J2O47_06830 [Acidimicrobiaceae bacterium]|nr:hypothetical protein [Acidimicrobiaceae bacterium]
MTPLPGPPDDKPPDDKLLADVALPTWRSRRGAPDVALPTCRSLAGHRTGRRVG